MSEVKYDLVIHHNDLDGYVSAWVIWMCRTRHEPELFHTNYGAEPPDVTNKRVAIVDFCYPPDVLLAMVQTAGSIEVFDHHETTAEAFAGMDFVWMHIDKSKAGCRLVWDHFCPNREPPPMVLYAEDYDLWRFNLPGTREYCAAVERYRYRGGWQMRTLQRLYNRPLHELLTEGAPRVEMMNEQIESAVRRAQTVVIEVPSKLEGGDPDPSYVKARAVNSTVFPNEVAHEMLADDEAPDVAIVWRRTNYGWHYHFRSRETNVREIAERLGGGGHRTAAGLIRQQPLPLPAAENE